MFLTKDDLKLSYGVDLHLAEAYVNRRVPSDNLYWKDRMIYLPAAPGYIFMPIFSDLLLRSGVNKAILLDERNMLFQEKILHLAAMLEYKKMDWREHTQAVVNLAREECTDIDLFKALQHYLIDGAATEIDNVKLGTGFPSLNRADSFLYSLVRLDPSAYDRSKAIKGWYALVSYFLILDDLADIKDDLKKGEENILSETGFDHSGLRKIAAMLEESRQVMQYINPVMGNRIDHKISVIDLPAVVRSITS